MLKSTVLIVCLCAATLMAAPALDESTANKFIVESSDKFSQLYNTLSKTIFELKDLDDSNESASDEKTGVENANDSTSEESDEDTLTGFFAIFLLLAKVVQLKEGVDNITTLAEEAFKFPAEQYTNEEIKIGINKLRTMGGLQILVDDYAQWSDEDFDELLERSNFCKTDEVEKKECNTSPKFLHKILTTSTNPDEILHYWKELRERNLPEVEKKMKNFIALYKKLGEKYGKSGKFAWFADYLDEHFGEEMEKVINELEPLYKELHAYIRYQLHEHFGEKVPTDGLIPHHLYEQVMLHAWNPHAIVTKEFKDVKLPVEDNFKESAAEVLTLANKFMTSLGFEDFPEEFWKNHVKELPSKGDSCNAEVLDSGNETYFAYCPQVNVKRFFQMHGYVSRLHYAHARKDLPFAYTEPYNFELATGEAVILAATTPKYLHQVGHRDTAVMPENEDMNRLYRLAIHTLTKVPEYFVHAKVVADVIDGTTPLADMNKHYWELMGKYVGVAAPVERPAGAVDFPPRFYKNIENNHQTVKFVTEIVGYQIYKSLCEKSGEYVKDDSTHSLHNCDFYNSKEAGNTLKEMMHLGSKKPWRQVLATVTGSETGMSGDAILKYYEPLQKWLHTKNTEHSSKVGW